MTLDKAIQELARGSHGAFFIDDTGSPGLADTPSHLHRDRKSWVAVYVPANQICEVMSQFPQALAELEKLVGAKEFHFIDIFQGKRQFEQVPFDVRLACFEFMVHLFQQYRFPILVQTVDPEKDYIELFRAAFPDGAGPFDLGNHEDLALVLLIIRAKWLLRDNIKEGAARLFLDEGQFKAGSSVRIPGLSPPFIDGEIVSAASNYLHPLQLADFAAFAMNRMQLLLGRENLNSRDAELLTVLSGLKDNFKNLTLVEGRVDQWPPLSQEALLALANSKTGNA